MRSHQKDYMNHVKLKMEEQDARERGDVFQESELSAIYNKLTSTKLPCLKYNHSLNQVQLS